MLTNTNPVDVYKASPLLSISRWYVRQEMRSFVEALFTVTKAN